MGGGVGGASILYWLTRLGWTDTVLVERARVTSGSTFHSAGLVGQLRGSLSLTRMMMNSVDLYRTLGEEVGLETGWHEVGALRLASSQERMEELSRHAGWAQTFRTSLAPLSGQSLPHQKARWPAAGHADDARPIAARLLPPRVGRPDHGRLRARPKAMGTRRHSGRLQRQAA